MLGVLEFEIIVVVCSGMSCSGNNNFNFMFYDKYTSIPPHVSHTQTCCMTDLDMMYNIQIGTCAIRAAVTQTDNR